MITLDDIAEVTWGFGQKFLLETSKGDFVWSSPDYGGDNTIKPFTGNKADFCQEGFMGRDKGTHRIGDYCGDDAVIVNQ